MRPTTVVKGNDKGSTCKVYIVGAGPGNPKLLTVRARELIESADVIIYDYLLPERILEGAKKGCVMVKHERGSTSQERLGMFRDTVKAHCREGAVIVRLHTGDPFIYGMGYEELEYLRGEGISYEVVPGITSALGVPSYAGIPLTARGISSTVVIANGHPISEDEVNWDALVSCRGTIVFLMGVSTAGKISRRLIDAGASPETPCCVISNGTMDSQRVLVTRLGELRESIEREGIRAPAVIVVGDVVKGLYG